MISAAVIGLNESLINEDRSRGGDDMRLAGTADNPAPTAHIEKVLPQGDVEAPVHAGHGEPHMLPWYLVKDRHGRVAQHLPWIATVYSTPRIRLSMTPVR